jgi:hypothetical protein
MSALKTPKKNPKGFRNNAVIAIVSISAFFEGARLAL